MTPRESGFSLAETLVALSLALIAASSVLVLASSHSSLSSATPEVIDLHQRARAALQTMVRDLSMAGAGPTAGRRVGSLVRFFAPVVPRSVATDAFDVARTDAVTLFFVPQTRSQTTLALPLVAGEAAAVVSSEPGCPLGAPGCGFPSSASALLFDDVGNFDIVAVTDVQPSQLSLRWRLGLSGPSFGGGDSVVEAEAHTYYWDSSSLQLRHHDVDRTDSPVIDNVVAASFEYYGEVTPPRDPRPPEGVSNCIYEENGAPRPELTLLGPPPFTLLPLPLSNFRDGPWCGTGATRFDADLLRVRVIRVRLRLQAARREFRGATGHDAAGTSTRAVTDIPDFEIAFDVAPRNLAIVR